MSMNKQRLAEQLAEVAAGKRKSADFGLMTSVGGDDAQQVAKLESHHEAMAKNADRMASIARENGRAQADAARTAEALARATQEDIRNHQQRMETLAEDRAEEAQRHMSRVEQLEREKTTQLVAVQKKKLALLDQEVKENSRHRKQLIDLEEQRSAREKLTEHEGRLRMSSSYLAAIKLAELRDLERPFNEANELDVLLHPATEQLAACRKVIDCTVAKFDVAQRAFTLAEELRRDEELQVLLSNELAFQKKQQMEVDALVKKEFALQSETQTTKALLFGVRRNSNPLTWFGRTAQERLVHGNNLATLEAALYSVQSELTAARRRPKKPTDKTIQHAPLFPNGTREECIADASAPFRPSLQAIETQITQWFDREYRTETLGLLLDRHSKHPSLSPIDFETCLLLDSMKAQGVECIDYPGLGNIPSGEDLSDVITQIAHLKKSALPFDELGCRTTSWRNYQSLKLLCAGYISSGEDDQLVEVAKLALANHRQMGLDWIDCDFEAELGVSKHQASLLTGILLPNQALKQCNDNEFDFDSETAETEDLLGFNFDRN